MFVRSEDAERFIEECAETIQRSRATCGSMSANWRRREQEWPTRHDIAYRSSWPGSGCQAGARVACLGSSHDVRGRMLRVSTSISEIAMHARFGDASNAIDFPSGDHVSP
jgi:hypothetical protein